jgi:hypothetical protein
MDAAALAAAGAVGLAGAAGLNAWVPLLATAIAARWGGVDLASPYDVIASNTGLVLLSLAFAADFVGDKIPAVDSVLHAAGTAVHPVAGAVVAASQAGVHVPDAVSLAAGALLAGGIHLGRAAVRPASTAGTAGVGNPVLSLLEDVASVALSVLAFLLPVLAALGAIALVALAIWAIRRFRAAVRRFAPPAG